ncbi:glycine cleavage system protein GcvH [Leucothrix arctica]|uniref:Glycine cleavage system H protein n=1 Tax=Leucothrix arctica TaxID=1481894 RepID=A0A317CIW6_9GAMM|nr:glycine cleavage system protein GcvH [Leucothrix arctica]PWQ98505.1 glycine cleavage system protein GcvH [Leucothrix arctica]
MSDFPTDLKYTSSHEWVQKNDDGTITMGISDHAQDALGDLVFVELPEVGESFGKEEQFAVVESVKAASDVYSPISGEVVEVNESLEDAPEQVNTHPFAEGWLVRIKPSDESEIDTLMDAEAYKESCDE